MDSGMKIILGRYMDGGSWPDAVTHFSAGQNAVGGVKICGPAGLLSLLEEKLGLPVRDSHGSVRIAAWEALLKKRVSAQPHAEEPFYAESLRADSWNTAKRILRMRDELKTAGALEDAGTAAECAGRLGQRAESIQEQPPRLAEMFRLEAEHLLQNPVPAAADRLRLVLEELRFQCGASSALEGLIRVRLVTPERCWQAPWRELFRLLRASGIDINEHPASSAFSGLTLTSAEAASFAVFSSPEREHIDLGAASPPEAAEALAAVLHSRFEEGTPGRIVLIRSEDSVELDGALARYGLPGTGCRNRSTARPFVQLLPLYLRLHLLPFDPETLRQFLLLPVNPLEPALRLKILRALQREEFSPESESFASWPERWQKAFRKADAPEGADAASLAAWICPPRRITGERIAVADIVSTAQKLKVWAEKEACPPLPKTAELCQRLCSAASSLSSDLSHLAFEKLLDSVLGDGESSQEKRQPVLWTVVSDPGQIWDEADTVIWWDFTDDGRALRDSSVWSDEEKEWLAAQGFPLFDIDIERCAQMHAMSAPFRFARRLITVTPRFHGPEECMPHPVRALLPAKSGRRISAASVLTEDLQDGFFQIENKELLSAPPEKGAWQQEKKYALELPRSVSPSRLEAVLDCPAAWYFQEVLGLDSGRNELSTQNITCGNLAHEVMEELLKEQQSSPRRYAEHELKAHIGELLEKHIHGMAARLALPEHAILREGMAGRLARCFITLNERLEKEGLVFLDSEQSYKGEVGTADCVGRYDLMLARKGQDVPSVLVDMKWSRSRTYREQAEQGRAIQLAAYYHLLKNGRRLLGWKDGQAVLAPSTPAELEKACFFLLQDARIHETSALDKQWERIEKEWDDICTALEAGILPLAESGPGSEDSPCTWCAYRRLCGRRQASADGDDSTEGQA